MTSVNKCEPYAVRHLLPRWLSIIMFLWSTLRYVIDGGSCQILHHWPPHTHSLLLAAKSLKFDYIKCHRCLLNVSSSITVYLPQL